jgi:bacterioferritin
MKGKKPAESSQIVDLLNQALKLEYSIIIHMPRIASTIEDEKTREMAHILGNASVKHADTVANAISTLGGNPEWAWESVPVGKDLVEIFEKQLDKEKLALQLHKDSASLIQDRTLKLKFEQLARDEEWHIKVVNDILLRLRER